MAERKTICLGMPSYGEITVGAAMGLYRASARPTHDLRILSNNSSLLAANMNGLWCWALNNARKDGVDYFAMLHADIEPEEFWLDKLIDELEAKQLDVLGVVAPIKDQRGITSTALGKLDGDTWRVHARLTMKEIHRLPETFTSEDVGFPLLLNTGCWVCRFDESWARQVHFTINDRICFDPKNDIYFNQVESEDWFVSRLWHELGLKIGCTRKVKAGHRGTVLFGNDQPWGENSFDKEYSLTQSVLDAPRAGDWFPKDVTGWLTEDEGRELARLATGKTVLEIGSYCGRSTICLAQTAKSVHACDTFDGRGTALPGETLESFKRNIRQAGVENKVDVRQGLSSEVLPALPPVFDLVFIDGAHDYESVSRDTELATALLRPGGMLVFHDYRSTHDPEVTLAVDELIAGGSALLSRCGTLAVVRPCAGVAVSGGLLNGV